MKKSLILILSLTAVLALLLTGLFIWKGVHHALALSELLEEWLDADAADQTVTLRIQKPSFRVDSDTQQLRPEIGQWSLTADTFWTEYGDEEVYGLTTGGITAYLRRGVLYMDTGKAYSLPDLTGLTGQAGRLAAGLLLYGRVTKSGDSYTLTMQTEELELRATVTGDRTLWAISLSAVLPDDTTVQATVTPKATGAHPIPQAVADAMVLAKMEPPMSLTEPMQVLLPAMKELLPLSGKLELGISSGILELRETVDLTAAANQAILSRKGVLVDLHLPEELTALSPVALSLLALRNGSVSTNGTATTFTMSLPGDTTTALAEMLVPQAVGLGIRFEESTLALTIDQSRVRAAAISAHGSVPFLFTAIPLTFTADLTVDAP